MYESRFQHHFTSFYCGRKFTLSVCSFSLFRNGKFNIFSLYLDRYLRLTPLLGVCILVSATLLRFAGNGPIWLFMVDFLSGCCARNWPHALMHIQNFYHYPNEICYNHSWSMSVDMQLYSIAPIIAYLIYNLNINAHIVALVAVFSCVACTLIVHTTFNLRNRCVSHFAAIILKTKLTVLSNSFDIAYVVLAYYPTLIRLSGWIIGFYTGYILTVHPSESIRISKVV